MLRRGQESDEDKCAYCGKSILSTTEFLDACESAGFRIDRATDEVHFPGFIGIVFGGGVNRDNLTIPGTGKTRAELKQAHDRLEEQRGLVCVSCGKTYCLVCMNKYAPPYPSGGKACIDCRGAIDRFDP